MLKDRRAGICNINKDVQIYLVPPSLKNAVTVLRLAVIFILFLPSSFYLSFLPTFASFNFSLTILLFILMKILLCYIACQFFKSVHVMDA